MIPIFKQEHSKTCGLACLRMIFGFYNLNVSEDNLLSLLKIHSFGFTFFELAEIANKYNFKCTAYTFKQDEFAHLKVPAGDEIPSSYKPKSKIFAKAYEGFIKQNKLIFHYPSRKIIKEYLDQNIPLIACTNNASLGRRFKTLSNGHYVVITKMINEDIYYNDPASGQEDHRPIDMFLASQSIRGSTSDGFLLAITRVL